MGHPNGLQFELCCIEMSPYFLLIFLEACFKMHQHFKSSIQLSTLAGEKKQSVMPHL